jgi:signal peptidase I
VEQDTIDMAGRNPPPSEPKGRPWVGILLSLVVAGFGWARAGEFGRAVRWYLGIKVIWLVLLFVSGPEEVPIGIAYGATALFVAAWIWMLIDSSRPGRMTGRLWIVFLVLVGLDIGLNSMAHSFVKPYKVASNSMAPTLQGGGSGDADSVVVDRLAYLLGPPERGDIVVFRSAGIAGFSKGSNREQELVSRIVGLPGERIEFKDGHLFVNGSEQNEGNGIPPIHYAMRDQPDTQILAYQVEAGSYFVVGDNSLSSYDSRYWGGVPQGNLIGKVTKIYYPFHRAGRLRAVSSKR